MRPLVHGGLGGAVLWWRGKACDCELAACACAAQRVAELRATALEAQGLEAALRHCAAMPTRGEAGALRGGSDDGLPAPDGGSPVATSAVVEAAVFAK